MDPVSAVGLASSILTFVEFAITLVAGSVTIYRSVDGALDENKELDKAINDLDYLSSFLDQRPVCKTEAESRIARIAKDCRADSKKLEDIIEHIANPKNKRAFWRSLKASWLSIRSRKDVTELKSRLQGYRSETLLQVTLLLREEQSGLSLGIAKIRDDCSQLKIGFRTDISNTRNSILEAIRALNRPDGGEPMSDASLADISKMLLAIQTKVEETQLHHRILRQLVFKDMNSRANQIHEAVNETYNWMLEDGPVEKFDERSGTWHMFVGWLRAEVNILFISGNPGSGKSALMKFLVQHQRTKEELAVWAGTNKLIFCVFYFWNSGSAAQRSLSGLRRSILFQSLSQQPQLMEEVFPLQVRTMRAFIGDTTVESIQNFDDDQIEEAFNLLLDRASGLGYRLCFFIDGLDECEGNRLKHEELALKLRGWSDSGSVKLCVSSRPYLEFVQPLEKTGTRMIQLHKLNESDIRAYCINRFEDDEHAQQRAGLCQKLTPIIIQRAQGVFLWVHLVIDMLLIGFRQADPDSVLLSQLQALPADLDLLYTKLREPIEADGVQKDRSNRILLLAAHNPMPWNLPAIAFSWLEEQDRDQGGLVDPNFPLPSEMKPYSEKEISKRIDSAVKQINGLAKGFLEINTGDRWQRRAEDDSFFVSELRLVQFCHRTARDYLLGSEDRHSVLLKSFPNFEETAVYTRIRLAEITFGNRWKVIRARNIFAPFNRAFRNGLDPDLVNRFELPLKGSLTPSFKFLPSSARGIDEVLVNPPERASFTEYAAFCGLTRFVLREVAVDATKLDGTSSCGNVLLAAVKNRQNELASELLRLTEGKNPLCEVWDGQGNVQSLVPICVLAIAEVLEHIIGAAGGKNGTSCPWSYFSGEECDFARELLKFNVDKKISLRVTVTGICVKTSHGEATFDRSTELRVQLDDADIVKLLDSFEFLPSFLTDDYRERDYVFEGAEILEKMRTGRFGRVLDNVPDAVDRLTEWSDQPYALFSDGDPYKKVFVSKIEWALQSQAFMELEGWVRFY